MVLMRANFATNGRSLPNLDETKISRVSSSASEAKAPSPNLTTANSRTPHRLAYIENLTGRSRPNRPTQYAKLEHLLQSLAELDSSNVASWVKNPSKLAGETSAVYAKMRASSAQTVQFSRRSTSSKLNPLEPTKSAADDLMLTQRTKAHSQSAKALLSGVPNIDSIKPAPLKLGNKWKNYASHPLALASKPLSKSQTDSSNAEDDIRSLIENPLASTTLRGRVLEWSQGIGWPTSTGGIPSLGKSIWESELEKQKLGEQSAVKIQKLWKGYRQAKKYSLYIQGAKRRTRVMLRKIISLWQRVSIQRPHVRSTLSERLICWRVQVCRMKIANEKAKDLMAVWDTMLAMKYVREWKFTAVLEKKICKKEYGFFMEWWLDFVFGNKAWKNLLTKRIRKILYHSFRALYFWRCCAAKCRRRAYKLFRFEESSIDPLSAPVDRFQGYGGMFNCSYILAYFKSKDWYERRVVRCIYVRIMPRILKSWKKSLEAGKKSRYAVFHYHLSTYRKHFAVLKEGMRNDSPSKVDTSGDSEQESPQASKFKAELVKIDSQISLQDALDKEVDDLMKLVDHEQREMFRRKLKRERKKVIVRVKLKALKQEQELLKQISEQHDQSSKALEDFSNTKETQAELKVKEEQYILKHVSKQEDEKWNEAKTRFIKMIQAGIDIISNLLERHHQEKAWYYFSECWRRLKKPCATTRMMRICRKIMHTAILTRMLGVCSWFVRMAKSIHRYRPLKLKLVAWKKWLKTVETNYQLITPNLKGQICRRRLLSDRFSDIVYEWGTSRNILNSLPNKKQLFDRKDMILALWMEQTQRMVTRREVQFLFSKRRIIRMLHFAFLFLRDRVIKRQIVNKHFKKTFLELNVCQDLQTWHRKFFLGMNHASYLRRLNRRLRQKAILQIKNGTNLPNLLGGRREALGKRCELEQCLLLRYCDVAFGKENRKTMEEKRGMVELYTSQVPISNFLVNFGEQAVLRYLGTVFSQRKNELVTLLQKCDHLAQRARNHFDSAQVGYGISNWLFKVRSFGLVKEGDRFLPRRKVYWKHVQDLFISAQTGHV